VAAQLAGESDREVVPALGAMRPCRAVGEDAAVEVAVYRGHIQAAQKAVRGLERGLSGFAYEPPVEFRYRLAMARPARSSGLLAPSDRSRNSRRAAFASEGRLLSA
jgi:hypothetical protein